MSPRTRILFLGVDAGDKDLILHWAKTGVLPTFRSLWEKGAWGATANPVGLFGGALWPSFHTGVSPARHGRHWFLQIKPGTYENYEFMPTDVKREPFWNDLSRAGKRVAIIDAPMTFPSQDLNGIHLVDWGTHDHKYDFCTWPPSLASDVESRFGRHPVGVCNNINRDPAGIKRFRDALLSGVEKKERLISYFLDQGGWDFFLAVFGESHCVGHQCWHLHDATHPQHDRDLLRSIGDPIKQVYRAIDAALGRLLQRVGPETTVFILASHGMGAHYDGTHLLDEILRRLEAARVSTKRRRTAHVLAWSWNRIPLSLRKPFTPVRDRVKNKVGEALPSTGNAFRKCFQVPNMSPYGGIRINLVGREPNGRVRPGSECDRFCRELSRDLMNLVNLDTGEALVRRVLRTASLYRGKHLDDLPDLLVEWNGDTPISTVYSPKIGKVHELYGGVRTGDHKPEGLFFAVGPSISARRFESPISVMDFAPTLASLLGVELRGAEGEVIGALTGNNQEHPSLPRGAN